MKLNDATLRNLKEPGKYFDGGGLYLELTKAGGRYWRLKYRFGGKEKRLAFGTYPDVGLKAARERAAEARKVLDGGDDPGELRKAAKAQTELERVNTLEAVTRDWLKHQAGRWEPVTLQRITASLESDIFPALGGKPMSAVKPIDLKRAVQAIEKRGASDMAARVLQRVKAAFRWALVHERIESNPMIDLVPGEMLKPRQVKHRLAMPESELPAFLAKLDDYGHDPHTLHALRLLLLTATRPGEVRGATWDEIDLDGAIWIIPAARMKMRTEHRVPLSRQAIEVLRSMQRFSGDSVLVFPSPFYPGKPLSENTLNSALARMGYKGVATSHGFRALFSTVANESGRWSPDAIERQLAHVERNQVRAAYHRSTYLKDRAELMQWWADHLDNCAKKSSAPLLERKTSGDTGTNGI
jgi:integrase